MSNKEKKIIDFLRYIIQDNSIIAYSLVFDGQIYASNRQHKQARGMVCFPKEICSENLKDLHKWNSFIISIPKEKANELLNKFLDDL